MPTFSCRRQAHLAVLNESCTEGEYVKLVEALCAEHNINLIKVSDPKKLGEWVGQCKIDRDGNARKVVGCSCVAVTDFGEESEAMNVLLDCKCYKRMLKTLLDMIYLHQCHDFRLQVSLSYIAKSTCINKRLCFVQCNLHVGLLWIHGCWGILTCFE